MAGYQCESCKARQPYVGESGPEVITVEDVNKIREQAGRPPIDALTVHSVEETRQAIAASPRGKRKRPTN